MPDWYKPGASQLPSGGSHQASHETRDRHPTASHKPSSKTWHPTTRHKPSSKTWHPTTRIPTSRIPTARISASWIPAPCLSTAGLPTRLASLVSAWLHLSTRILVATGNRRCSFLLVRLGRSSRILQLWKWRDGLLRRRYGLCKRRGQWHCE